MQPAPSSLTLITPPALAPVTLAQAKAHLRVPHDDDDDLIAALIAAAVDRVEGMTARALVEQTLELRLDAFPCGGTVRGRGIRLPRPPLIAVESVEYVDPDGALQTLASSAYTTTVGAWGRAVVLEAYNAVWPVTRDEPEAVRVRYQAGYAETAASPPVLGEGVPAALVHAIKLLVGHWYANRESVIADPRTPPAELPEAVEALVGRYRIDQLGR